MLNQCHQGGELDTMNDIDIKLFDQLIDVAKRMYDGHITIMRFTRNWRIAFGTPLGDDIRDEIALMAEGPTFAAAAERLLAAPRDFYNEQTD